MIRHLGQKLVFSLSIMALAALAAISTACTTLLEGGTGSYTKTKNSAGETVYRETKPAYHSYQPVYSEPSVVIQPTLALFSPPSGAPASTYSQPYTPVTVDKNVSGHLEVAATTGNVHLGLHGGYNVTDWFMPRIGVSAFISNDFYAGFDLSGRFMTEVGHGIKPFVGIGGYLGDTKSCQYERNPLTLQLEEVCDKKFLGAAYAEAGVEVGNLSMFVRDYRLTRAGLSVPTPVFWGLGLRF